MKAIVTRKNKKKRIIELNYKIKTREQAAYETIMNNAPDLRKVLFFSLITPAINWDIINSIIDDWEDREIWEKAIKFVEMIGIDNISAYNTGMLDDSEIPD